MASRITELTERAKHIATEAADRLVVIQYLFLAMFIAMGGRLWFLQVIDHERYVKEAENNRLKTIPIPAPRGMILDREGRVIVENRATLSIMLNREEVQRRHQTVEAVIQEMIDGGIKLDREYIDARLDAMRTAPAYYPVLIKESADPEDVAWVRAHRLEHPELDVVEHPQRLYPYGTMLAHVVGHVGEISRQQLEKPEYKGKGYRPGDVIGQDGVEKIYDRLLRGRDGMRRVVVDSTGREISEIERIDPIPGQDVRLTIDLDLQKVAEEKLGDRRGVIIVMDPRNGEVLTMVSHPAFDPNLFSQRITTPEGKAEYQALKKDPQTPLLHRAIQGTYPTGSTWKILVATASLEEKIITPEHSSILCGGGLQMGNRFVRCMGNHGMPDLHRAIVVSCDGYFYRLGLKLGVDRMHDWVKRMGMGQRTGIDLPNEKGGIIPGRDIKAKLKNPDPQWRDHDTVIASVGQGSVAVTPLQLLRAIAGISMGGVFQTPHVFKTADSPTKPITFDRERLVTIPISQQTREMITDGMWGVVNEGGGTGGAARVTEFNVSGKTGTAQVVALDKATSETKDHAWFVSFAPKTNPEIAVVVLVENIGFGGTHSAPIAQAIYQTYYNKHYRKTTETQVAAAKLAEPTSDLTESPAESANPVGQSAPSSPPVSADGKPPAQPAAGGQPVAQVNQDPVTAAADAQSSVPPREVKRRPRTVNRNEER
jgi:penicillin-binding protein 2